MEHLREGKALKVSNMSCAMREIGMWDQDEQVSFEWYSLKMNMSCFVFSQFDTNATLI